MMTFGSTSDSTEIARMLMDHGADPDMAADNGKTPREHCAGGAGVQAFVAEYAPKYGKYTRNPQHGWTFS